MPRQFVERLAFGIVFAGDDGQMFRQRDAALLFELDGGPLAFRHQRPRQPVHVHAEVVQPPQINIRRDGSHLQGFQNRFALGFDDDLRQQHRQRLVLRGGFPAVLVRSLFGANQRLNGVLPCPGGDAVVLPARYALAICRFKTGWRSELFLASTICLGFIVIAGAEDWCVCRSWCPRSRNYCRECHDELSDNVFS